MNSLFFLASLVAVGWLAIWAALPRPWQGGGWWPFDMREPDAATPAEPPTRARGRQPDRRAPARGRR